MEIVRDDTGIQLTQRKYAFSLLKDTSFQLCKPAATPMETTIKLSHKDSELVADNSEYKSIVDKLLYLNMARPDLSYAVQQLPQLLNRPIVFHWTAMHMVLRYIKSAPGQGLLFKSCNNTKLAAYCDSDWVGCEETRSQLVDSVFF